MTDPQPTTSKASKIIAGILTVALLVGAAVLAFRAGDPGKAADDIGKAAEVVGAIAADLAAAPTAPPAPVDTDHDTDKASAP